MKFYYLVKIIKYKDVLIKLSLLFVFATLFGVTSVQASYNSDTARIPVLEYHNFGESESRWTRSFENFKKDLEFLYNNNYRVVSIDEFLKNDFSRLQNGEKPVLITFDDSSSGQLSFDENNSIRKNTAIGIIENFKKDHSDFGEGFLFFMLPNNFGNDFERINTYDFLARHNDYDIGNHTISHANLSNVTIDILLKELNGFEKFVDDNTSDEYTLTSLAYPFGAIPKHNLSNLYNNGDIEIQAAFLVGAHPTLPASDKNFDPYRIPRIQAIESEFLRWFGRKDNTTEVITEKFIPYVVGNSEAHVDFTSEDENNIVINNSDITIIDYTKNDVNALNDFIYELFSQNNDSIDRQQCETFVTYYNHNFYFKTERNMGIDAVVDELYDCTPYYYKENLKKKIIEIHGKTYFSQDEYILVPGYYTHIEKIKSSVDKKDVKGIYLTGFRVADFERGYQHIIDLKESGGNGIVFDLKNEEGYIHYNSENEKSVKSGAVLNTIGNVQKYISMLQSHGIYTMGRVSVFKDKLISQNFTDMSFQSMDGGVWQNREGIVWLDAGNENAQQYNLDLINEISELSIDEIQLDYIRFPALGNVEDIKHSFDSQKNKFNVISDFVKNVYEITYAQNVYLSMDVFGSIVWNNEYDSEIVGQKVGELVHSLDVISPMIYPSHFGDGFGGYDYPALYPEYFIGQSMILFQNLSVGSGITIRPWIQGFTWKVNNFSNEYITRQIEELNKKNTNTYLIWNAGNNYTESYKAMNQLYNSDESSQ